MKYHNVAGSTSLKISGYNLGSNWMNLLTAFILLLINATSHLKKGRNAMFNITLSMPSTTKSWWRNYLPWSWLHQLQRVGAPTLLGVCRTHIAISGNLVALGLAGPKLSMPPTIGNPRNIISRDRSNTMGTNTSVATLPSHILLDIHCALWRRAHITNVADWAIGNPNAIEEHPRNLHKTPTGVERKEEDDHQREPMKLALTRTSTWMKWMLQVLDSTRRKD